MGIPKVLGAIFLVLSSMVAIVNTFLYLNSPAFIDYNTGGEAMGVIEKMSVHGILIPYIFCAVFFVLGYLLSKDRVLEEAH